jgi:hypothetical protein
MGERGDGVSGGKGGGGGIDGDRQEDKQMARAGERWTEGQTCSLGAVLYVTFAGVEKVCSSSVTWLFISTQTALLSTPLPV